MSEGRFADVALYAPLERTSLKFMSFQMISNGSISFRAVARVDAKVDARVDVSK